MNQSGQPVDMTKYPVGTKVFFYRPPSKQEADSKGRRAKHTDHYVGWTSKVNEAHWNEISTAGNGGTQREKHHIQKGHRNAIAQTTQDG